MNNEHINQMNQLTNRWNAMHIFILSKNDTLHMVIHRYTKKISVLLILIMGTCCISAVCSATTSYAVSKTTTLNSSLSNIDTFNTTGLFKESNENTATEGYMGWPLQKEDSYGGYSQTPDLRVSFEKNYVKKNTGNFPSKQKSDGSVEYKNPTPINPTTVSSGKSYVYIINLTNYGLAPSVPTTITFSFSPYGEAPKQTGDNTTMAWSREFIMNQQVEAVGAKQSTLIESQVKMPDVTAQTEGTLDVVVNTDKSDNDVNGKYNYDEMNITIKAKNQIVQNPGNLVIIKNLSALGKL